MLNKIQSLMFYLKRKRDNWWTDKMIKSEIRRHKKCCMKIRRYENKVNKLQAQVVRLKSNVWL